MSYINTRTKKDQLLEDISNLGGKRTFKEWSEILMCKPYDVSNAVYGDQKFKDRYIQLVRYRPLHKMPIKEILQKLKASGKEKMTCEEMVEVLGYTNDQVRSLIVRNASIKKYYTRVGDKRYKEVLEKFSKDWIGFPRYINDWVILTGLDRAEITNYAKRLEKHFDSPIIVYETKIRMEEIKKMAGQLTLTEWSERFEVSISAMHHFFSRKSLHHLRKNPPEDLVSFKRIP